MDSYHKSDDAGPSFTRLLMDIEHLDLGMCIYLHSVKFYIVLLSYLTQVQCNVLEIAVILWVSANICVEQPLVSLCYHGYPLIFDANQI